MLFGNWVSAELGDSKKRLKLKASKLEVTNGNDRVLMCQLCSPNSAEKRIFRTALVEAIDP
jgi:hypothetical protein